MDKLKLFFSTFTLVFLAELGDKTQITSFSMSAGSGDILSVIIGASLALTCSTLTAVIFGHLIATFINKKIIKFVSGFLFILTGLIFFIKTLFNFF